MESGEWKRGKKKDGTKGYGTDYRHIRAIKPDGTRESYSSGFRNEEYSSEPPRRLLTSVRDEPAVIHVDGTKEWWRLGRKHRENGPAVVYPDGREEWWLNNKQMPNPKTPKDIRKLQFINILISTKALYKKKKSNPYISLPVDTLKTKTLNVYTEMGLKPTEKEIASLKEHRMFYILKRYDDYVSGLDLSVPMQDYVW